MRCRGSVVRRSWNWVVDRAIGIETRLLAKDWQPTCRQATVHDHRGNTANRKRWWLEGHEGTWYGIENDGRGQVSATMSRRNLVHGWRLRGDEQRNSSAPVMMLVATSAVHDDGLIGGFQEEKAKKEDEVGRWRGEKDGEVKDKKVEEGMGR